jgi:hypothetical protein
MTKQDELIVEEIVTNLRPFKRGETFAAEQTGRCIEILGQIAKGGEKRLLPSEAKKRRSKYRRALKALIAASEQLPPGAFETYMFFAQTPERHQRDEAAQPVPPHVESSEAGAELLRQLKTLARVVAKDLDPVGYDGRKKLKSLDGILPVVSLKTAVAGWARLLIIVASRQPITGTADGPYLTISSLLFEAIRGERIDFKRWCEAEINRQREHDKMLQSFA